VPIVWLVPPTQELIANCVKHFELSALAAADFEMARSQSPLRNPVFVFSAGNVGCIVVNDIVETKWSIDGESHFAVQAMINPFHLSMVLASLSPF
jgi:hypothetical protein